MKRHTKMLLIAAALVAFAAVPVLASARTGTVSKLPKPALVQVDVRTEKSQVGTSQPDSSGATETTDAVDQGTEKDTGTESSPDTEKSGTNGGHEDPAGAQHECTGNCSE